MAEGMVHTSGMVATGCGTTCSALPQLDAEHSAHAGLGTLDIDAAVVVFLDDALGEREAQSPSATLGGNLFDKTARIYYFSIVFRIF